MILSNSYTMPSAKMLREALKELTGIHLVCTSKPEKIKGILHLRFGNSYPCGVDETEFNSPKFIKLISSKTEFSSFLLENKIKSPEFNHGIPKDEDFPLLTRKTLNSCGGKGIVICENIDEFNKIGGSNYYWTKYIPTSAEYRVHVLGGEIKKIQKKERIGNEEKYPLRNMDNGYHFSIRTDFDKFSKLQELITKLNSIINGKFYSLDVGYSRELNDYIIFEGNSASGMNENTANLYAEYLNDKIF